MVVVGCGYYIYLQMRWRLSVLTDIDARPKKQELIESNLPGNNLLDRFEKGRKREKEKT